MKKLRFCYISGDGYDEFYNFCKRHGWTNGQSYQDFDELSFFEGDPDMIKINGCTGYFYHCAWNNAIYYWGEYPDRAEEILRDYFTDGDLCKKVQEHQSWGAWYNMRNGIAYRGGSGYFYTIYDTISVLELATA